jgi:Ni/Co efflux regulator RcnB
MIIERKGMIMTTSTRILATALAGCALASTPAFAEPDTDRDVNGHRIEQRIAPNVVGNSTIQYDQYGRAMEINQFGNGHLARDYWYNDRYDVRNWRDYGVSAPPAGYRWVRSGDRLMLVSRSSGRIAQVLALR